MDFGDVIKTVRADPTKRFGREAWEGRAYIQHIPGADVATEEMLPLAALFGMEVSKTETIHLVGRIVRCTLEHRTMDSYWIPSQEDMLADDWMEVA